VIIIIKSERYTVQDETNEKNRYIIYIINKEVYGEMYEAKSREEYNMMVQVIRIIRLPQTNFSILYDDLSKDNMREVASILNEARGRNT